MQESADQHYAFGPFRIDVAARHLLRHDDVVPLTAKVFDTLLFLVRNHDRTVGKDELIHAVWPGTFVSDDSLVQNISAIRRALGDDPSQPRYIATHARRGYRFIAPLGNPAQAPEATTPARAAVEQSRASADADAARPGLPPPAAAVRPAWRTNLRLAAAVAAGTVVTSLLVMTRSHTGVTAPLEPPIRFRETLPPDQTLEGGGALSPDSRYVAYVAHDAAGVTRLWLRGLDMGTAEPLRGTEGAQRPFWSPDSRFVAFFANGQLKRIAVLGGPPRTIVATQRGDAPGGAWGAGDTILYADQGRILSVDAFGSERTVVVEPDRAAGQAELRWPQFLPDGEHFLFSAANETPERAGIYVGNLKSKDTTPLLAGVRSAATFAPPGYLLYVRDRVLLAQRFDPGRRQLYGDPMLLAGDALESVVVSTTSGGLLTFTDRQPSASRLVWFDRAGREVGAIRVPKPLTTLALSPNGRQLLGAGSDSADWVMWLVDLDRNVSTQLAVNAAFPAWSPDGTRFAFTSVTGGGSDLFVRSTVGAASEEALLKTEGVKSVDDWSPDGRFIVFTDHRNWNLWLLPTFGDRVPRPFLPGNTPARRARISPDGRSIAYVSDEAGTREVYVDSFPTPGAKRRVSTSGGTNPIWRRDGRELFYLASDQQVMAVRLVGGEDGELEAARPLFAVKGARSFVVTPDGQRFLVAIPDPSGQGGSLILLTKWESALRP